MATKAQDKAAAAAAKKKAAAAAAKKKAAAAEIDPGVSGDPGAETLTGEVTQRKVGRGSRRRIRRALDTFENAVTDLCKELDLQIFLADSDGVRVGDWPILDDMKSIPAGIRTEVNKVLADNEPAE